MFFEGFTLATTTVPGGVIRYRTGGTGPALLLLHGNPQTHAMWHQCCAGYGAAVHREFARICAAMAAARSRLPRRTTRPMRRPKWPATSRI